MSRIPKEDYHAWYRAVWTDIGGVSSNKHPAPFPVKLANRLVRMFSFVADTVLDPFGGSGTTCVAAAMAGRNSIAYDIEAAYLDLAESRIKARTPGSPHTVMRTTDPALTSIFYARGLSEAKA